MDANLLGNAGVQNLIPGLIAANGTLVELHLDGVLLDSRGLEALLNAAIEHNLMWTTLKVGLNNLSDMSVGKSLGHYLAKNPQLESLDARGGPHGKMNGKHFREIAKRAQFLRFLILRGNDFRNGCYEAFAAMLPGSNLEYLDFGQDEIAGNVSSGVQKLVHVLNQSKLQELYLSMDTVTRAISAPLFADRKNVLGKHIIIGFAPSNASTVESMEELYYKERYADGRIPPPRCVCKEPSGVRSIKNVDQCNSCTGEGQK